MGAKELLRTLPGVRTALGLRAELESRWFDWRNRISTIGDVQPEEMKGAGRNLAFGRKYNPTTLRAGKRVFTELPVSDFSKYTFVDFGSGKGRMLFLAAEYPFRRIIGVEYAADLQEIAQQNIRRYRNSRQKCFDITSENLDAADFEFPRENSVFYFFSPFNRPVMEPLIQRLDRSVSDNPRDVLIVYLNPELSDVVESTENFKAIMRGQYYTMYRTPVMTAGAAK